MWPGGVTVAAGLEADTVQTNPAALPDGAGGVIVAFTAMFTTGEYAGDSDILGQRLSADGKRLWSSDTQHYLNIGFSESTERTVTLVSDGVGGAIALFEAEPRRGENAGDADVLAQRVSAEGELLWNGGDRSAVISSGRVTERAAVAGQDGAGGLIAAFEAESVDGERKGDCDVLAQRLNSDGAMQWNEGKRSVGVMTSKWRERHPVSVADGAWGLILIAEQHAPPDLYAGDIDLGAERVSDAGQLLWGAVPDKPTRAIDVSCEESLLEQSPSAVSDGVGGAVVVFEVESRIGANAGRAGLWAQRLGPDGHLLWSEDKHGVTVAPSELNARRPILIAP